MIKLSRQMFKLFITRFLKEQKLSVNILQVENIQLRKVSNKKCLILLSLFFVSI